MRLKYKVKFELEVRGSMLKLNLMMYFEVEMRSLTLKFDGKSEVDSCYRRSLPLKVQHVQRRSKRNVISDIMQSLTLFYMVVRFRPPMTF